MSAEIVTLELPTLRKNRSSVSQKNTARLSMVNRTSSAELGALSLRLIAAAGAEAERAAIARGLGPELALEARVERVSACIVASLAGNAGGRSDGV